MIRVEKLWGHEEWIENNELYCLKRLIMNPGWQSSIHKHLLKDETFFVIAGQLTLEMEAPLSLELTKRVLNVGDSQRIKPNTWHRFSVLPTHFPCAFIEGGKHHSEDDVIRKTLSSRI